MHRELVTMSHLRRCPFFLFVWKVRRTIFFPPGWCFFYLVLGRLIFLHQLYRKIQSIRTIKQYGIIPSYKNCLLPYGLGRDRFQIIEETEPPEMHKQTIINWCDQLNCCEIDYGFIQLDQTIKRTSRKTKIFMQNCIFGRYKIFRTTNIHARSARHCGPHSSSIKKSILNYRDVGCHNLGRLLIPFLTKCCSSTI